MCVCTRIVFYHSSAPSVPRLAGRPADRAAGRVAGVQVVERMRPSDCVIAVNHKPDWVLDAYEGVATAGKV